ncbi:chitosanase [Synchytrium microbalum]|uniref:Chitosanase n=1 Tax=Synchytrium microbalum TaxID=1806994 RepID=A0A507C540_9FUNG|nr:chitosanase [Synchytrium microbalum]TPX36670.1 chitosanase [Synchytrium microbalum]
MLPLFLVSALLATQALADGNVCANNACRMTPAQKSLTMQLSAFFDFGVTTMPYCQCSNLLDGNGFTCGFAGFNSASGSILNVINYYSIAYPDNAFLSDISGLGTVSISGSSSIDFFSDLPTNWNATCKDPVFISAQISANDDQVYNPSQTAADMLGLVNAVSRAALYDTFMEQGSNNTNPDSAWATIAATTKSVGGVPAGVAGTSQHVDENTWLHAFLQTRRTALLNPSNVNVAAEWASSVGRVDAFMYILQSGNVNFTGNSVSTLNIYGIPTVISV